MRKLSLFLVGLTVLILSACQPKTNVENTSNASGQKAENSVLHSGSSLKIAYIDSDDFMDRYFYVQVLKDELEGDTKAKMETLKKKQKAYEKDAAYFQKQLNAGNLSEAAAQPIYEKLMKRQQELYDLNQKYSDQLSQKEALMNNRIFDTLQNFIDELNATMHYDMILTKNQMTNILYINDQFNITDTVVNALNARYKSSKEK